MNFSELINFNPPPPHPPEIIRKLGFLIISGRIEVN